MSWYDTSRKWILEQKAEHPEMKHEEIKKHCSKNYPFAERKGYAYKAFLKAMRDVFGRSIAPNNTDGQIDLFNTSL